MSSTLRIALVYACLAATAFTSVGCIPSPCTTGAHDDNGSCVPDDAGVGLLDGMVAPGDAGICGPRATFKKGVCILNPGPAPGEVGSPCKSINDCAIGTTCEQSAMLPGGYCTVVNCNAQRPCPIGSICYAATSALSMCVATCDPTAACRAGSDYLCQPIYSGDVSVCVASCALTKACSAGSTCDAASGLCVLDACDPTASDPCSTAETHKICYPDASVQQGGYCLHTCDPSAPVDCNLDHGDVCQPFAEDPVHSGYCSQPTCNNSEQCPGGSQCKDHACLPPPLCDSKGQCADTTLGCFGGAGGQCMPKCPTDTTKSCADTQSSLACYSGGATPLCLPLGSFPGSACRSADVSATPCDSIAAGDGTSVPMLCDHNQCVVQCNTGGDALCTQVDKNTACAARGSGLRECLTKGSFPGGACATGGKCGAIDLGGGQSAAMSCEKTLGICLFDCSNGLPGVTKGKNSTYCAGLDPTLACARKAASAPFPSDDVCLPAGSFAGGPCGPDKVCGSESGNPMVCEDGTCLLTCSSQQSDICPSFDSTLACASGVYAGEEVCLPRGTVAGGACDASGKCGGRNGDASQPMTCYGGRCLVGCDEVGKVVGYGEALCQSIGADLTCSKTLGHLCVHSCDNAGTCPPHQGSCYDAGIWPAHENACLPNGTFPGAGCRNGVCDGTLKCETDNVGNSLCYSGCTPDDPKTVPNEDQCASTDASTSCSHGYFADDVCITKGTFAGGPCDAQASCALDNITGALMKCETGVCRIRCTPDDPSTVNNNEETCRLLDPTLVCRPKGFYPDDVCVKRGSYEGGPCLAGTGGGADTCSSVDLGGSLGVVPMICAYNQCRYDCSTPHNTQWCNAISSGLTCHNDSSTLNYCQ